MMAKALTARTTERAQLRRGPAWRALDVLLLLAVLATIGCAVFLPALLADIGDTVLGSDRFSVSLGTTPSGLLLACMRWALALQTLYLLWHVREAPLPQRVAWAFVGVGILMNYARNIYSGNPATLSFFLIQSGLIYLIWRLTMRPTIWQQLVQEKQRADEAEAELARLRGGR